jgi:hypothetical protein
VLSQFVHIPPSHEETFGTLQRIGKLSFCSRTTPAFWYVISVLLHRQVALIKSQYRHVLSQWTFSDDTPMPRFSIGGATNFASTLTSWSVWQWMPLSAAFNGQEMTVARCEEHVVTWMVSSLNRPVSVTRDASSLAQSRRPWAAIRFVFACRLDWDSSSETCKMFWSVPHENCDKTVHVNWWYCSKFLCIGDEPFCWLVWHQTENRAPMKSVLPWHAHWHVGPRETNGRHLQRHRGLAHKVTWRFSQSYAFCSLETQDRSRSAFGLAMEHHPVHVQCARFFAHFQTLFIYEHI